MTYPDPSQVTLLPKQLDRLAREAAKTGAAIAISQKGSVISVNTGHKKFRIDAQGRTMEENDGKDRHP